MSVAVGAGDTATVLGGGIIGATTAWRLADDGWDVELWSDRDCDATVSAVAAALWRPYRAEPQADVVRWSARTLEVYLAQVEMPGSGITMVPGLELGREPLVDPAWGSVLADFGHADVADLPPGYVDALAYRAPVAVMTTYLPWLLKRLAERGVRLVRRRVESLAAVTASRPWVVNATGLAARELVPDGEVHPVRGQVLRLTNPGITHFRLDYHHPDGLTYVIPRGADVIVGGTDQECSWDTVVDAAQSEQILLRGRALHPDLERAEVLEAKVGLRPARSRVRVERERSEAGWLVHNYGHGGAGMTTAWGCADDVADLLDRSRNS
ncbi:FAD-dependent oxidoreductase [Nocardioides sp. LHD-245]|uniref:FAD-dependent oxidoreductase n=1 Tax=Nocardioides sp. LHD-245 TaxID=3051387 RepID=UPI0027DFBF56|nr:FAD-dependent oxidoreductase [Nocardioides sp. LHD-245]